MNDRGNGARSRRACMLPQREGRGDERCHGHWRISPPLPHSNPRLPRPPDLLDHCPPSPPSSRSLHLKAPGPSCPRCACGSRKRSRGEKVNGSQNLLRAVPATSRVPVTSLGYFFVLCRSIDKCNRSHRSHSNITARAVAMGDRACRRNMKSRAHGRLPSTVHLRTCSSKGATTPVRRRVRRQIEENLLMTPL